MDAIAGALSISGSVPCKHGDSKLQRTDFRVVMSSQKIEIAKAAAFGITNVPSQKPAPKVPQVLYRPTQVMGLPISTHVRPSILSFCCGRAMLLAVL